MKIFGRDISLKVEKNTYSSPETQKLIARYPNLYLGNNIGALGDISLDRNTPFRILKKNVIASRALRLVSERVGTNGFALVDDEGTVVPKDKAVDEYEKAEQIFRTPSLYQYIYDTMSMYFGAGQKFSVLSESNGVGELTENSKVKILDSRNVNIVHDRYGNPTSYQYSGQESYQPGLLVDQIVFKNFDRPVYGMSIMESVVIDGVTDMATSDKLYHFFRNSAMPNVVYLLKEGAIQNEQQRKDFEKKINERHGGVSNSSKPFVSSAVADVKTIELSHKDLQLLEQRLFTHKEFGITFGFDLRLLSYMRDGGSYSEIDSISIKQANSQLDVYARYIEDGMKLEYEKFIEKMPYTFKLQNEYFSDTLRQKEIGLKELELGAISRNEYRDKFDMEVIENDEYMESFQPQSLPNNNQ